MSSPTDQERVEAIGEQLRAKIASKFTASTFLAGFALTLLGGLILALWQSAALPSFFPPTVGAVFFALVLFVFSIIRLDELTMPKRFWPEDPTSKEPPLSRRGLLTDQDLWALQKRMVFYWQRLTVTATIITAAAAVLLMLPLPLKDVQSAQGQTLWWTVGAWVTATLYCYSVRRYAERRFDPLMRPSD